MSAQSVVEDLISNAIEQANTAAEAAKGYSDDAKSAAQGQLLSLPNVPNPDRPNILLPPFNPEEDLGATFTLAFDNALADFGPDFTEQINDFLDHWFPSWKACLKNTVEPWICATITAGGVGLPDAVSNAIWNRERERELLEVSRLQSETFDAFGARGFNLPSGILFDERARIGQAGADRIAAASRDRAIQDGEMRLKMLQFAIEKGVQMRLGVLDALVSFLNTWLKIPALAIEKAKTLTDAKTKLWEQSAAYYRALIASAELILRYDELRMERGLRSGANEINRFDAKIKNLVGAALGAAEAMGKVAAAAHGSINALGDISHQTTASQSGSGE